MAPRKNVQSLECVAFKTFEVYLKDVCFDLLNSNSTEFADVCSQLKEHIYGALAPPFHNTIGQICLKVCKSFYQSAEKKSTWINRAKEIAGQFGRLVVSPRFEGIENDGDEADELPEPIATAIFNQLPELTGIRELNISSFKMALVDSEHPFEDGLSSSFAAFSKLIKFSSGRDVPCSDAVVAALCGSCPELETVIVWSKDVSDASVGSLIQCRNLKKADLLGTRISSDGMYKLLTETKSETLTNLKLGLHASAILARLNENGTVPRTFKLKMLNLKLDEEPQNQLQAATKFFPSLTTLSLQNEDVPDLSILIQLARLTHFQLRADITVETLDRLVHFLAIKGRELQSLSLVSSSESLLPLRVMMDLCALCPNVTSLDIDVDSEPDDESILRPSKCNALFHNLESLDNGYSSLGLAKFVLRHAHNIKHLTFTQYGESVTDDFFNDILLYNPLAQLRYLEFGRETENISSAMFEKIVKKCKQLHWVELIRNDKLETVEEKRKMELVQSVRQFIRANNYAVTIQEVQECYRINPDRSFTPIHRPIN